MADSSMADPTPPKLPRVDGPEDAGSQIAVVAKKSVGGNATIIELLVESSSTVGDLVARLAEQDGCDASQITVVCKGAVLGQKTAPLQPLAEKEPNRKLTVVYIVRKPPAAAPTTAPAAVAAAAASPAPAPAAAAPSTAPAAASVAAIGGPAAIPSAGQAAPGDDSAAGQRVLLLLRHGQCCHEDEADEMKALTMHGQQQAEESAAYIARLFAAGRLPEQRALLHSTSRRARETANKLPNHLPELQVCNAGLLRETDPTKNPLRAEEVFERLFSPPPPGAKETLIIVAHNNIILYLLMRAAGVPIDRAAQAWNLFHLRHASVTRVHVSSSGARHVVAIGAAGHIPHACVTWNNITGADLAAWSGAGPQRRKFSGRMLVLVTQASAAQSGNADPHAEAAATHIQGLSEYMTSGHVTVAATEAAERMAVTIAQRLRTAPQIFPASVTQHPEGAFLQFFRPPDVHSRDTIVMIAEDTPVLYWLLRALRLSPEEAMASTTLYRIGHASVTLVNVRADGTMKVVTVGDTGHLPLAA